ncbi:Putative formate dehydrogenase oxidoreductase protein [Microbacterium sp. 8M]|uniref:FdhF/YdeP family oxidoreductase n=1 Tax=Microbacterium sp. 8M TaxID=2653153 RepID=UPI0012F080F9|nr:FdhF/YdeP family oxidoreductase [Microbacterium sp. 8M]VXC28718.1 Putative formate dehydrogenase oxidoreductase protein [Microbacterium sp. 8M]
MSERAQGAGAQDPVEETTTGGVAFGLLPAQPRQGGYGPVAKGEWSRSPYRHPAAGWGAAMSVGRVLVREREPIAGSQAMVTMNHGRTGFDCPGCAWPDDRGNLLLDICENGIKHVTWEMTHKRVDRRFFAEHTVTELASWTDFDLEDQGRLTEPMSYDPATDRYVPISWDDAFALVGEELRGLASPDEAAFYTSGRLSNEATFLYQLMVREYGTNNLPDCSNMCHEASGRALTASIATGKGTVDLEDWEKCDALFVLGVNAASNAPRMLTALAEAVRRGAQVVHVNPLIEAGATRTIVPHEFVDMALFKSTDTSTMNLQVRPGGDFALIRGMAKVVFEAAQTDPDVLDHAFLAEYTNAFEEYRAVVEATPWDELVTQAGLSEDQIRAAAAVYLASERTVISWCLGVSQHEHGVDTIREIVNLLLLRGNIGREGAGPSPVRGHSNVQGNRTCGIDHRPPAWTDRLAEVCRIDPPRRHGLDTVGTVEGMHDGSVKVFVGMGGNFVLAAPDTVFTAEGLRRCRLTVQVSTKLNRSHLVHGEKALILPCLGRTERDQQASGPQGVTVEDAMSMVHLSTGRKRPASAYLKSEPAIIAGIAKATLPESQTPWDDYVADYDRIRDVMAQVLPGFEGFNQLIRNRHGFRIPQPARERVFRTPSGKAEFSLAELPDVIPASADTLVLQTMRSHDQWNTTIYSNNDRYRGVKNLRELIFMHVDDMRDRGIAEGDLVDIVSTSKDGSKRSVQAFRAIAYDLPRGSAAGYMPELNVLLGPKDFSAQSDQPLMKSIQVTVAPTAA